jgi:hypothetical protein
MDRWNTEAVICKGGLLEDQAALLQGTVLEGTATNLINYEPALEGGYARIQGFAKFDSNAVTGATNAPILGTFPALDGVFAARKNVATTSIDIFYSTGSGWGTKINTANRDATATKYRATTYSISEPVIVFTDGKDPALKYNGTTDTLINGTGAPTAPKYSALFLKRLVLAPASNTSSIALSSPSDDTDFEGSNGALEINIGDTVTGLRRFREQLYIFCENSIFKLVGNTNADIQLKEVTTSIGCISGDSIQEIGGDLVFLAPDGLRSVAATERLGDIELGLLSQAIQPSIRPLIGTFGEDTFSSVVIRKKSQYRLFIFDSSIADDNAKGFLGKLSRTEAGIGFEWSKLQGINPYSADSAYDNTNETAVFGHPTNGFVYQMESGNDFGGTDITAIYESPDITFNEPDNRKVLHKIALNMQVGGDLDVSLNVLFDNEDPSVLQPSPVIITQSGEVPVYGTAVYGTDEYGALTFPVFKENLSGSGFITSFKFTSTNSNPSHRIDSYTIQYALKGRR